MVRSSSTSSCFKLITCGGNDSVDRDDLEAPENKGSSDKRGWSFRKRSARHRVLSNSVASEVPSGNKASPDSATVSFEAQGSSTIPEKTSVIQWTEEKSQLQIPVESKLSETVGTAEDDNIADGTTDEASVIIIQAAIRRFLAQRNLVKHKNVIKLQAAVRGHIVRSHAVGSLRCVQAIVKMQALVRERHAHLLLEGSSIKGKGKENMGIKPDVTYTSIEKLLSHGFARQLLESAPRTKTINMKCDPLKADSAWRWLERWMSVSSMETGQSHGLGSTMVEQQAKENIEELDCQLETVISSPENCQSRKESNIESFTLPSEADENIITYDADSYHIQECRPTLSSASHSIEQSHPLTTGEANSGIRTSDSLAGNARESDVVSKTEPDSFHSQSEMELEQNTPILETLGDGSEIEGKKSSVGSRKASNPAFIAAQSKFEELSLAANLGKSVSSSDQVASIDSYLDADLPVMNHGLRKREIDPAESSFSHTFGVQVGGSECGTELSISSTLDSPDRSEVGVVDFLKETKSLEDGTDYPKNDLNLEVEEKVESKIPDRDLSYSNSILPERHDSSITANGEHVSSRMVVDSSEAEQKPDTTATGVHMEQETEKNQVVSKSSPEASPKSHVTATESQGTPSSQVSLKPKKIKSVKNGSNHKHVSAGKELHLEPNQDYGDTNNSEDLPKEHKSGKRRNSLSSAKTDHGDQEPRDSSSSNSLPSYMQATESARAKALSNSSPRSSPDVQDKDLHIRKRHSLPGASTRQGSPRVHRAQQGVKGNGTHSPQERKWRR